MKKLLLSIIVSFIVLSLSAQVLTDRTTPELIQSKIRMVNKKDIDVITMPSFDLKKVLEEDLSDKFRGIPFRFGHAFFVKNDLNNSGSWYEVDGGKVWSLEIVSKDAFSINLAFDKFYLPESSTLYIYNESKTVILGPITSKSNRPDYKFATDLVEGSSIILEYFQPSGIKEQPIISISTVVHGYRNIVKSSGYGQSGSCNNDINCSVGDNWQDESDAVAMILINNTRWCSGCLLNNTAEDFTPYFLTANHCVGSYNVSSWTFRFQYKSPTCNGGDASSYYSFYGAELLDSSSVSDYALLELDQHPTNVGAGISYAGWSKSSTAPTSGVGIHHPSGDVMKISFDNGNLVETAYGSNSGNNYWKVDWDDGTTEGGSSGSPLLDQNQRVVGQLRGGYASCYSSDDRDWYGAFDVSWGLGLSYYLDSDNTNNTTTNTIHIPYISGPSDVCISNRTFTVNNLPTGATVAWTKSTNLTQVGGATSSTYVVKQSSSSSTGDGWVEVRVNGGVPFRKNLWLGKPGNATDHLAEGEEYSEDEFCTDSQMYFTIYSDNPSYGVSTYHWNIEGASTVTTSTNEITYYTGSSETSTDINVRMQNTCGYSSWYTYYYDLVDCEGGDGEGMSMLLTPNPAELLVAVDILITDKYGQLTKLSEQSIIIHEPFTLTILDQYSRVLKSKVSHGERIYFDVSDLKGGLYFVNLSTRTFNKTQQLIIE